jgi:hypothetical protein
VPWLTITKLRASSTESRPRPAGTTTNTPRKSNRSLRDIVRANHSTITVKSNEAAERIVAPESDEQNQKQNKKKTMNQGNSKAFKRKSQRPGRI